MDTSAMQEDPMLRLQYYHETGQTQQAQQYEQYLRDTGQYRGTAPVPSPALDRLHAAYRSGALGKQMAAANADDAADSEGPGYFSRLATHVLNTAQGIPGMEALEAGAGALGSQFTSHPMNYSQSLNTLRDQTGQIGGLTSAGEHMMGSLATLPFLPANPAASGAILGGADQALNADPNQSLMERAGRTAVGAGAGALIGRFLDHFITAGRAETAPGSAAVNNARIAARDAAATPAYNAFRKLGDLGRTPDLDAILDLPVVKTALATVKGESPSLAKLPDTDASVLDAVYKRVGNKAFNALHGTETGEARQALMDAIEGAAKAKGGTYAGVVDAYRDASRGINAVQRGSDMIKGAGTQLKAGKHLNKTSVDAFQRWAAKATPDELSAAQQGILGGLHDRGATRVAKVLGLPVLPVPTRAAALAPGLLRVVNPNAGNLANYGLLAGHSITQP